MVEKRKMDMARIEHQKNKIEMRKVSELVFYQNNARTHDDAQVKLIAKSITEFGFVNPVLTDGENNVIAGHGRILAAKKLGLEEVPCLPITHMTDAQRKAYILADNQIATKSGWDEGLLRKELDALMALDFDISVTGFSSKELDALMFGGGSGGKTDEEAVPELQAIPVSAVGDVWICGKHRVMCGDSTSAEDVTALLAGDTVDMVLTDPPYGISIVSNKTSADGGGGALKFKGTVGGGKIVKAKTYDAVIGDDTIDVAIKAIELIKTLKAKVEVIWGGNYYAKHLENSPCWVVWDKDNTGNFADAELAWTNQKTAVRIFKHLWNGMSRAGDRKTEGKTRCHPTQKPVALSEWCINAYGLSCKVVLDLFGGSGSCLIACEKTGRDSRTMEISPNYVDVIVKRWQDFTGEQAVLSATGKTFEEVCHGRKKGK